MTRSWSPIEVPSKNCKNCNKRIYLDSVKHKFYDDPELTQFHVDEVWKKEPKEPESIPLFLELIKKTNILQESNNHLSRQNIETAAEISKLKKSLWEIGQVIFAIQQEVSK